MNEIEKLIAELCPNGVEWKELGEVCVVKTGQQINKTFIQNNLGRYPVVNSGKEPLGFVNVYNTEDDPIGITSRGAGVGYVSWNEGKYFRGNLNYSSTIKDSNVILPKFLYYFLKNSFKAIENLCTFEGIPALNKSNLEMLKIPIPPLKIQQEIVKILDKFTDYVTELTTELTLRQKQYSFYRDKLLSFEDEVYQVEWKALGELLEKGRGTKITASQMKLLHKEGAPVRIFAGGKTYADVSFEDIPEKDIHQEAEIIVKSRGIIDFEYYAQPFSFKNEFWSYKPKVQNINLRYVFHYLKHNKIHFQNIANNMQMPQISSKDTEKYKIPVPSLEIQTRIVQVLDNFDTVCNDLNIGLPKEIELRQKQYEYFRDKLLTFTAEGVYTDSTVQYRQDIIRLLQWVFGPIRVKLSAVINLSRGKRLTRSQLSENNGYPVYQNSLKPLGYYQEFNRSADTTFVICAGAAGEIAYSNLDFWAADDVFTLDVTKFISSRFMYYTLLNIQESIKGKVRKASIPRLSKGALENIIFILPPITKQKSIVSILDKFDILINVLSQGLPKEIGLRQKQYEYFRDKLLKFK